MGCGTSFVKYVLFFFNLLFALVGLGMVGLGTAFLLNWRVIKDATQNFNVAPYLFIVIGAVIFIIAFFGCCGAIRESHCMVVTYAIFLIVVIIVEVILAVCMFVYADSISQGLGESMDTAFNKGLTVNPNPFGEIEKQLGCCGKTGPSNYVSELPRSCCKPDVSLCSKETANQEGCTDMVVKFYEKWNKTIAGVAIGVACVEVVGALFALCLANSIRNMDRRYA